MAERRIELADRIFDEALELAEAERDSLLAERCGHDAELRSLVERLLRASESSLGLRPGGALLGELGESLARELDDLEADLSGRRLGPYRVLREIGRGGMAVVYLAEREAGDFEQRVAIKLLRGRIAAPDSARRFHQERQILARSTHPNVARLLDGGVTGERRPYLVMEHVEGEPIDRYCDGRRLTVRERLELFLQAAEAVEYAHRSLVVHRDIKPSNILVTADGHLKLLDFGIAKLLDPEIEATRTELRPMTPAFASPEQLRGDPVTTATDVYQLGLLLYLLLTGCWPYRFDPGAEAELVHAVTREPATRPSAVLATGRIRAVATVEPARSVADLAADRRTTPARLRRQLAGDLDTILVKCLRKNPERRYLAVAQLIEDVEAHLAGRPIFARPDSLGYRFGKLLLRHKVASVTAAAALVVVVSLLAWDNTRLARERDRAQMEVAKATEVSEFLTGLFAAAAPTRSRGETVTVRELLDRGAERIRHDLAGQPELQASMMTLIGSVYGELAFFTESEELLAAAVALHRERPGEGSAELARALVALGQLHERTERLEASRAEIEEALALLRSGLGLDHPEVARTEIALGTVLSVNGEPAAAQAVLEHAIAVLEKQPGPASPDLGRGSMQLGVTLLKKGDFRAAIRALERARGILEPALGPDHDDSATALFHLANALRMLQELEPAERAFRDALSRFERLYGPDHPQVARACSGLGLVLRSRGRWEEGEALLERAIGIWSRTHGEAHIYTIWGYHNLGLLEEDQGRHERARELFRRAVTATESVFEPGNLNLHVPLQSLGRSLVNTGRAAEAIPYLSRSLAICERHFPGSRAELRAPLAELGRAYVATGEPVRAEEVLRRALSIPVAEWEMREQATLLPTLTLARALAAQGRVGEAAELLAAERAAADEEGRAVIDEARADLEGGRPAGG